MSRLLRNCREAAGDGELFDLRYCDGVVTARGALEPQPEGEVLDLAGAFVSPGLIDAHVHLGLGGPPEAAARASVAAGITAVRDLGGRDDEGGASGAPDPVAPAPVATAGTPAPAPRPLGATVVPAGTFVWAPGAEPRPLRVVSAGRALTRKGGYGAFLGVAVADRAELLAAARTEVGRGAAVLKVIVSGVVDFASGTVGPTHFSTKDLRELVALARHAGVPVAAHANGTEAIGAAVAASVDSVEHGILISETELRAMAAAGTAWVPTLTPLFNLRGDPRWPQLGKIFERHLEAVAHGRELGIVLVAGSDAGSPGVPHGSVHTEIALLRRAGLTAPQARWAATGAAAELLGLGGGSSRPGGGYGRLEVGAPVDLVWFAEDPFL